MSTKTKAYLALLFICIVWGTTYISIRIAVLHYPAFLFAAIRQVIAGLTIAVAAWAINKDVDLSWKNLRHQILTGFLMITLGNGFVTWGERTVPGGIAALICCLMPICAALINVAMSRKERLNGLIILGMLLGIVGVGFIVKDDLQKLDNAYYLLGAGAIFIATVSWAYGSVLNKKYKATKNPIFNSGLQLLSGGLFLFIGSPLIDDYTDMNIMQQDVLLPLLYVIIFGSILAYTAYMYALKELPVGVVTLYAYINPLVAVVLGYYMLGESLTIYTALAFVSIAAGVWLVNRGYQSQLKAS